MVRERGRVREKETREERVTIIQRIDTYVFIHIGSPFLTALN